MSCKVDLSGLAFVRDSLLFCETFYPWTFCPTETHKCLLTLLPLRQLLLIMNFYLNLVGDLAYHVKKMRQKNEHFTESVIMQWFV